MARYGCIVMLFILSAFAIIGKLSITTIVQADEWNRLAIAEMNDSIEVFPERGSILSANGNILACNQTLYDVRIDVRHPRLTKLKKEDWVRLDSLADSLDFYYPRRELAEGERMEPTDPKSWRTLLHEQLSIPRLTDRRAVVTVKRRLTQDQYDQIRNWPYFKDITGSGSKLPLTRDKHVVRVYPFGDMAKLSIGRVYEDSVTKRKVGYAGLEKALDSLLYGQIGYAKKQPLTSGYTYMTVHPARRGYDVVTTIDIDIQDILEGELLAMCDSAGAEWGTAILMEVKTGEIRAISNVERDSTGRWVEARNRALDPVEPGSVMKPISLMVAFEDGLVHSVNDTEDCSPFMRTSDHSGGGRKTMKAIIETSSNTGIARVIFRKYKTDPAAFRERLAKIGFFEKMNTGIAGERLPHIPVLVAEKNGRPITMTARHLDLARQAFGYNTMIPPLYTLSYYNAIANDGKYVRPHLMRALRDENGRDSILHISPIRESICSPHTAAMVRECIREVVWGKKGTARALQDDRVEVAGKTGTVVPYDDKKLKAYDNSKRRFAFCGFFPYENPRYTCIVVMQTPAGATSAGRGPGRVLLNTALKMFARGMLNDQSTSYTGLTSPGAAQLYGNGGNAPALIANSLGIKSAKQTRVAGTPITGKVPDVVGMDMATAVSTLEKAGVNVERVNGSGVVVRQSLASGGPAKRGAKCTLWLNWK